MDVSYHPDVAASWTKKDTGTAEVRSKVLWKKEQVIPDFWVVGNIWSSKKMLKLICTCTYINVNTHTHTTISRSIKTFDL